MARLQSEMGRLFDGAGSASAKAPGEDLAGGVWYPAVDVTEDSEKIVLSADLPGLNDKEVEIQIERDTLTLRGERKLERKLENKKEHFYRFERLNGTFTRSFSLPPTVDAEKITAAMKDGVLTLTLPKRAEAQPRQIRVKVQ